METTKFNMIRSCFNLQEMFRIGVLCASWQQGPTGDSSGFGATLCLARVWSHGLSCDNSCDVLLLSNVVPNTIIQLISTSQHIEVMFLSNYIKTYILRFGFGSSE